jgi:methylase of polypeptide subunit release factors
MKNLEEMANFEKKKIKHSNSVYVPKKDSSILHGSPSLKKASREPAVLEVNLSE